MDILTYDPKSLVFILSCPLPSVVKVRAALTLQSTYQGQDCAYHVLAAENTLLHLKDSEKKRYFD